MRILHLSSLYPPHVVGGCEVSVEQLAEELQAMGHDVGAACISRQAETRTERNGVSVYRMLHHNDFWLEDWQQHSRQARRMQKLRQQWNFAVEKQFAAVLDDFKPDVLNTHSLVDVSTLVWRAARRRNIPIVHTLCEYDLICGNAAMFRQGRNCAHVHLGCRVVNMAKPFTTRWVDGVASVGTETLNIHLRHGLFQHVPDDLRRVIFYSCTVPGGDAAAWKAIDRTGRPMTFGYIGRINDEKGVGTMIEAFRAIGPGDWRCVVAGKALDDSLDRFKAQAAGLPIEFLGWTAAKDYYETVDVSICPSIWAEPSPRTIYEAYFMGVNVIGAASGGIPELVADREWLFEPGNSADLASRIKRVLAAGRGGLPEVPQQIVKASQPRRVAENYLQLYRDVLERRTAEMLELAG